VHCDSESCRNNLETKFNPDSVEIDSHYYLVVKISNKVNRLFVQGDHETILVVEFLRDSKKKFWNI
jgi:hypothetical protein